MKKLMEKHTTQIMQNYDTNNAQHMKRIMRRRKKITKYINICCIVPISVGENLPSKNTSKIQGNIAYRITEAIKNKNIGQ